MTTYIPSTGTKHATSTNPTKHERNESKRWRKERLECCGHHPKAHDSAGCVVCPCKEPAPADTVLNDLPRRALAKPRPLYYNTSPIDSASARKPPSA